jgi:hypothetical protein
MQPFLATPTLNTSRAAANRLNATHSTGPRSHQGKLRSSQNALTHGLTSRTAVLPSEALAAYQLHCQHFRDEYQPATPTEIQLVRELADTAWRLNRIPLLEARLISGQDGLAILDAHRVLQNISVHSNRLSRQFHKTLDQLRAIQTNRREREARDLKQAAALLELAKSKGTKYDPAQDGFVFPLSQIESHSLRLMRQDEAHHFAYIRFYADPKFTRAAGM